MSYYLDQLLDAQRRAECEKHDKDELIAVQPYYWPQVPWRTDRVARPVADRRGPRASRWGSAMKTLTDEQIDRIAENCAKAMPNGIQGFCVTWGWRQFARELLDVCKDHERADRRLESAQRLADALEQVLSQDFLRRELHYIDRGIGTAVQPGLSLIAARDAMAAWKEANK